MRRSPLVIGLVTTLALLSLAGTATAYYNPTVGRWITRDPGGYQDGAHLYEYVRSDPARHVDESALAATEPIAAGNRRRQIEEQWAARANTQLASFPRGAQGLNARARYVLEAMSECLAPGARERLREITARMEELQNALQSPEGRSSGGQDPAFAAQRAEVRALENERTKINRTIGLSASKNASQEMARTYAQTTPIVALPNNGGGGAWGPSGGGVLMAGTNWSPGIASLSLEPSSGDADWGRTQGRYTPPQRCLDQLGLKAGDPRLQQGLLGLAMTLAWEMNHWTEGKFENRPQFMKLWPENDFWSKVDCCCLRIHFGMPGSGGAAP